MIRPKKFKQKEKNAGNWFLISIKIEFHKRLNFVFIAIFKFDKCKLYRFVPF